MIIVGIHLGNTNYTGRWGWVEKHIIDIDYNYTVKANSAQAAAAAIIVARRPFRNTSLTKQEYQYLLPGHSALARVV